MKVTYYGEPKLSPVGSGSEWVVLEDFYVGVDSESGDAPITYRVPAGFTTDLASVPRLPGMFLLFGGKARRAAILHDYLYHQRYPREAADLAFREAMRGEVPDWAGWIMWKAVRIGGESYYREKQAEQGLHPSDREAA